MRWRDWQQEGVWQHLLDRDTNSDIALVQIAGRALRYLPGMVARIYTRTMEPRLRLAAALLQVDARESCFWFRIPECGRSHRWSGEP